MYMYDCITVNGVLWFELDESGVPHSAKFSLPLSPSSILIPVLPRPSPVHSILPPLVVWCVARLMAPLLSSLPLRQLLCSCCNLGNSQEV